MSAPVRLPTEPGFYVGDYPESPSGKILIELLNSPKGQWVDNTDSRYLEESWVRQLGNLTRLVPCEGETSVEAVTHYRILTSSPYSRGEAFVEPTDYADEPAVIANYFGLPVTNNPGDHRAAIDAGDWHAILARVQRPPRRIAFEFVGSVIAVGGDLKGLFECDQCGAAVSNEHQHQVWHDEAAS